MIMLVTDVDNGYWRYLNWWHLLYNDNYQAGELLATFEKNIGQILENIRQILENIRQILDKY